MDITEIKRSTDYAKVNWSKNIKDIIRSHEKVMWEAPSLGVEYTTARTTPFAIRGSNDYVRWDNKKKDYIVRDGGRILSGLEQHLIKALERTGLRSDRERRVYGIALFTLAMLVEYPYAGDRDWIIYSMRHFDRDGTTGEWTRPSYAVIQQWLKTQSHIPERKRNISISQIQKIDKKVDAKMGLMMAHLIEQHPGRDNPYIWQHARTLKDPYTPYPHQWLIPRDRYGMEIKDWWDENLYPDL